MLYPAERIAFGFTGTEVGTQMVHSQRSTDPSSNERSWQGCVENLSQLFSNYSIQLRLAKTNLFVFVCIGAPGIGMQHILQQFVILHIVVIVIVTVTVVKERYESMI